MSNRILIIAEAGVNHNGNIELAKKLIDKAAEAKADIVKFQTFISEEVITGNAVKAVYQAENTCSSESQLDMIKKLELKFEDFVVLREYCEFKGIKFLSTPFDLKSVHFLKKMGLDTFKIPSGEITNLPLLKLIGSFGSKIIISTGMCTLEEIESAIDILIISGTPRNLITVLHCNTEYPTPMVDVNLKAMIQIRDQLGVKIGYSDHTIGIEVPIAAASLGAEVIEKHFTLDKDMPGPDHKASLDPQELALMVSAIRNIEKALGSGIKKPTDSELKNIAVARKSIHLNREMKKGEILSEADFAMKRPGDGISPMEMEKIEGRKLKVDLNKDHKLSLNDLE